MTIATLEPTPVGSPYWWTSRLYDALMARRPDINRFDDYYQGRFPLPWLAPQAADEFRRILKMSRANYTGLVIDAMCERMAVEGFRLNEGTGDESAGDGRRERDQMKADRDLWRIW